MKWGKYVREKKIRVMVISLLKLLVHKYTKLKENYKKLNDNVTNIKGTKRK